MDNKLLTKIVAIQSIVNGFWLASHKDVAYYSPLENIAFLDSPLFWGLAIFLGIGLLLSLKYKWKVIQRVLIVSLNMLWMMYTTILILNEFFGVANMDWVLFLGYNVFIYIAARHEVF